MKLFLTLLRQLFVFVILLLFTTSLLPAQDTVWVQTLNFNDITKRRDIYQFPDSNQTFRKILMYYTLKCDPQTTRDKYNCGEWDYLTYSKVYVHTGIMDSNSTTYPLYKVGKTAPDTIFYTMDTTFSTYQHYNYEIKYDSVITEKNFQFGNGTEAIGLTSNPHRFQFIINKSDIKSSGMKSGNLTKLKIEIQNSDVTLQNLVIRLKNVSKTTLSSFEENDLTEVFNGDYYIKQSGINSINFTTPFKWNGLSNLLIDLSYDSFDSSEPLIVMANDKGNIIANSIEDSYFYFDGQNDLVDCGNIEDLNNANQFTFETWVRIDKWKAWANILGKGDKVLLQTGSGQGDIYCIVRNPDNTYGYIKSILPLHQWIHLAMVYDGSQAENNDKLKLYIDGFQRTLTYKGNIPETTPINTGSFSLDNNMSLNCGIDEVRIWKTAIDANSIKEFMNKPLDNTHQFYNDLLAYYPLDLENNYLSPDLSQNHFDGRLVGIPEIKSFEGFEVSKNMISDILVPNVTLIQGEYESHLDSTLLSVTKANQVNTIIKYQIVNRQPIPQEYTYAWISGYTYTYDPDGNKIDSTYNEPQDTIINDTLKYYEEPFEIVDPYEIGRFITPYGINLDLGPDGFTWIYDVTDYEPLLHGDVDFSSGNNQELIDVKFAFIKGTPPRKVLSIDRIWGPEKSYKYKNLDNDVNLSATTLHLLDNAKQFMVRARFTGHGHNSNDGNYPHCCEWKDNTHYLFVNNEQVANWHIFRNSECASNPVFPQGGTWPGAREGWCPGDIVYDYDFEITDKVKADSVNLDYSITPVPSNNQGMGNGNYVVAMQLFEFGDLTNQVDAEIYNVFTPNDNPLYSRKNPICSDPIIVVRNNGKDAITSLKFTYSVSGGTPQEYDWAGNIPSMLKDTIILPVQNTVFWIGDDIHKFTVTVSQPNGLTDEYSDNDSYTTHFNMPDLYNETIVLNYKTNQRPQDFTYRIKDIQGEVLFEKKNLSNSKLYSDTLYLPDGCFTLELTDRNHYGLSYWAYPDQGNGYFRINSIKGKLLKSFNPDFGIGIFYSFDLGDVFYVNDRNLNSILTVFPNPTTDKIALNIQDYFIGNANLAIYDYRGNLLVNDNVFIGNQFNKTYNISSFANGVYYIRIFNDKIDISNKFVKRQ